MAGPCLLFEAIRNGGTLIGVVLGSPLTSYAAGAQDAALVLSWGFSLKKESQVTSARPGTATDPSPTASTRGLAAKGVGSGSNLVKVTAPDRTPRPWPMAAITPVTSVRSVCELV